MGILKKHYANSVAEDAARAREEGRTVFVARIPASGLATNYVGSMGGMAEMIEAIEQQGWRLEHWQIATLDGHGGQPIGYPLFRRVG